MLEIRFYYLCRDDAVVIDKRHLSIMTATIGVFIDLVGL